MIRTIFILLISCWIAGCSNYLDEKPDKSLATIETSEDLRALLDNEYVFIQQTLTGEDMSDNYYVLDETWNSWTNENDRNRYIWAVTENEEVGWRALYQTVYHANVILEEVEKIKGTMTVSEYNDIKGSALYYRGLSFYELMSVFSLPYKAGINEDELGIPLRTISDINIVFDRASIKECYQQINSDIREAADLLPLETQEPTRPSKLAAWSLLARISFDLSDYEQAFMWTDQALKVKNTLLDYSRIDYTQATPFIRFNEEIIHFTYRHSAFLAQNRAIVDSLLYNSYDDGDYRKKCFFEINDNGFVLFKGSYVQNISTHFTGTTTAELFLTFIESAIRTGKTEEGKEKFASFLMARYKSEAKPDIDIADSELLELVLNERRKELIFRNRRWADIRRLNLEGANIRLERFLNDRYYTLEPNSLSYATLIPIEVIRYSGISQNKR